MTPQTQTNVLWPLYDICVILMQHAPIGLGLLCLEFMMLSMAKI
jgi:hypothetical protein